MSQLCTGSGLANLTTDEETKKLLECPVCLEIALPPIYSCQTGHIICHECKPKLQDCVLCKSQYTNSRSFPLEALVQSAKFYCSNRQRGCEISATIDELKKHHEECPIRPMGCHLNGLNNCKGTEFVYKADYINHLENVHNLTTGEPLVGKPNTFIIENTLPFREWRGELEQARVWTGILMNFDGKTFVNYMQNRGSLFHIGFFLIGRKKSEDSTYAVRITIQKRSSVTENKLLKYEVTTLVPSVRDFQEKRKNKVDSLPNSVVYHKDFIDSIGHALPVPGRPDKTRLYWDIQYEIIKQ